MKAKSPKKQHGGTGAVRIIAGEWRGRKLPVLMSHGLRPTSDRVRETLFNWLMPYMSGSRCLDLFAGTGALGFEACSRGAQYVDFIEQTKAVCEQLNKNIELLNAPAQVYSQSAESYLKQLSEPSYDIVFVDPPFEADLLDEHLELLSKQNCLLKGAYVYVESCKRQSYTVPNGWELLREKSTKQVSSCLFLVDE